MTTIEEKFKLPKMYRECSLNIWSEFHKMINTYNALDLTMGCPDFSPSERVTGALEMVAKPEIQQNYNPLGQTKLLEVLAELYSKLLKRKIYPEKELITMSTGCQSLHVIIMTFVEKNDEVIIIEPYFDFYETLVSLAGGKCRFVPLRLCRNYAEKENVCTSYWSLDNEELQSAFNKNTKLFILNTPNNPLGKVFTHKEISAIADLCKKWNVVCLADEVYEFFVYPPHEHIRISTLPSMWERTVTMICPGKTFGVTGWELGVAYSSEELVKKLQITHQNIVHTNNIPIQEAFAMLYKKEIETHKDKCILTSLTKNLEPKRDFMMKILKEAGMNPILPEGGFFIVANWSSLASKFNFKSKVGKPKDIQFAEWMIRHIGLAVIPITSFYSEGHKNLGENYVRFCFYKKSETLQKFANIIQKLSKTDLTE
ncbi:kynurenine aminotransferase-like [Harmonia axyridis]|uniref:kynurenine aminotransferase-like n=1 Tax=Harmonia axyridis TaxID=115357 RepID=UPI001E277BF7|nr:kynurenine aminotransferase-like [Harmonia axyridis]